MRKHYLTSVLKEHNRSQGFHRIYVSFPVSKNNKTDTLLTPQSFSSWISDLIKADIYYTDYSIHTNIVYDDLFDSFDDIELMVVLVDKEYLKGDFINNLEIEVAEDRKIPILPILFDTKCISDFNEKFKHKQCIVYKEKGETTHFFEKLEQYLIKNLEGGMSYDINELEALFNEPVFLSYRKKDKRALKDFLCELHYFSYLQPYSFWYDDFLNPGNNYDDEIREVLDKSNIFILFITKNIFEPGNYVLDIEYLYAVNNNKTIIGVTSGRIDKKLIESHFPEIKTIFKAKDIEKIATHLKEILPTHNINKPHDKFLLGQSYYYGIGVELNKEVAGELFDESYQEGEKVSAKYLANSYFSNDFTSSNILKAIEFQKDYVDFISGKGIDFKKNIAEKRLLTKYYLSSHQLKNAYQVAIENVEACTKESGHYIDCVLDKIEVILNMRPIDENIINEIENFKDKIIPFNPLNNDETNILSFRLTYLTALYYFAFKDYSKCFDLLINYNDLILKNFIFTTSENIELTSKVLYLLAEASKNIDDLYTAQEAYQNLFVVSSLERSLDLSFYSEIALYHDSILFEKDEEVVQNLTKEYISSTSFIASEDRTRFDFLNAYFLAKSKDLVDNIKGIYLLERYTQLDLNSFIEEKIDLYSKIFVFLVEEDVEEVLNNMPQTPYTLRALSYFIVGEDLVVACVAREIFLRQIMDINDPEIENKKEIINAVAKDLELLDFDVENIQDYRITVNNMFFYEREMEDEIVIDGSDCFEDEADFDLGDDFDEYLN